MPLSARMLCSAAYWDNMASGMVLAMFTRQSKRRYWGQGKFLSFLSAFLLTLLAMVLRQGAQFYGIEFRNLLMVFLAALGDDAVLLAAGFMKNRDVLPSV